MNAFIEKELIEQATNSMASLAFVFPLTLGRFRETACVSDCYQALELRKVHMNIPHTIMTNMICIHGTTSSILMTDENDKWPRSGFR